MFLLGQQIGGKSKEVRILGEKDPILLNGSRKMGYIRISARWVLVQSPQHIVTCTAECLYHSKGDVLISI